MKKTKEEKGITLVALIITIIVLLILSAIAIMEVNGKGIIAKARQAKEKTQVAQSKEKETSLDYSEYINDSIGKIETAIVGQKANLKSTIDGKMPAYNNPVIPRNFTPINVEEAIWDEEGGTKYNKGLVVKDENENEWVWVPVEDVKQMYDGTLEETR